MLYFKIYKYRLNKYHFVINIKTFVLLSKYFKRKYPNVRGFSQRSLQGYLKKDYNEYIVKNIRIIRYSNYEHPENLILSFN